ncbi:MAG: glutamate--tRNA ligase, partial [Caulobacteraceae bacterium]|nr:glutamate--tRNA ligase [Caulobacteraceae bacterium]
DLAKVSKAPARLDFAKLASVNAHFMKLADDDRLLDLLIDYINHHHPDWPPSAEKREKLRAATPILKQRAKTVAELADQSFFLLRARPYKLDEAAQKAMKDDAKPLLARLSQRLQAAADWSAESLSEQLAGFAQDEGVKFGAFGPALRAALTGGAASPELGQVLSLLGRDESLARLGDHI